MIQMKSDELSFELISSNWRMQNNEIQGPNCLFSLLQVQNGVPATLTIYGYEQESKTIEEVKTSIEDNTRTQQWDIISSKIVEINSYEVLDLIALANIDNQQLELHTISTLNNGKLYVFELLSFADDKYASSELRNIFNTLIFF